MQQVNIATLKASSPGLTQSGRLFGGLQNLNIGVPSRPWIFTSTYMSSLTGDFLFEVGKGDVDPSQHTRMIMQHARNTNRDLSEIVKEYEQMLSTLGFSPNIFLKVISGISGAVDRPIRQNAIPKVTPTYVHELLSKQLPKQDAVLVHLMTDFVCHMLRPFGWIMADAPYVYRLPRTCLFPKFDDLVDSVHAYNFSESLRRLADADIKLVETEARASGAIMPGRIASALSNAIITAFDISRNVYDATSIVRSVLSVCGRVWSPNTHAALEVSSRVRNFEGVNGLVSNLSLFCAYQNMLQRKIEPAMTFSDEEMVNVIIPAFINSVTRISSFEPRAISDAVGFIGKKTCVDYVNTPAYMVLFENWDFSTSMSAFTPVRQTVNGKQRYLLHESNVSSAVSACMSPVRSILDVQRMVDNRLATYELMEASKRQPAEGTQCALVFPSIIEKEILTEDGSGDDPASSTGRLPQALQLGSLPEDSTEEVQRIFECMSYDYNTYLLHLAVAKAGSTSVAEADSKEWAVPFLTWEVSVSMKKPIGEAAIVNGRVITTEPLELLAYVPDFAPSGTLNADVLPLHEYEKGVHIWPWHENSLPLTKELAYVAHVGGHEYATVVTENEMLALGTRRGHVRFLKTTVATAIARIWHQWHFSEDQFILEQKRATKDKNIKSSYEGRRTQNALRLINNLAMIGASGAGANATRYIRARIAEQMKEKGEIDEYNALHVGAQKHRLNVWAGLATLRLLYLVTEEEVNSILEYLKETNALSLVIALQDGAKEE